MALALIILEFFRTKNPFFSPRIIVFFSKFDAKRGKNDGKKNSNDNVGKHVFELHFAPFHGSA